MAVRWHLGRSGRMGRYQPYSASARPFLHGMVSDKHSQAATDGLLKHALTEGQTLLWILTIRRLEISNRSIVLKVMVTSLIAIRMGGFFYELSFARINYMIVYSLADRCFQPIMLKSQRFAISPSVFPQPGYPVYQRGESSLDALRQG
jgi:hypothetical protein